MNTTEILLLLVPLWPGLLGLTTLVMHERRLGGPLALMGALPALWVGVNPPPLGEVVYAWLLFGARLGANEVDAMFLLFTAIVWLLASGFALGWMRREPRRERFYAIFLLTMTGNLGAVLAQDIATFYGFFALMSFAAYGLVVHAQTERARHAARVYIVLVVIGEGALALAMIMAAGALGVIDFDAVRSGFATLPDRNLVVALAFLGFGIKAGVLILHVWLPLAHPVAPAPASAVLSGTIIVTGLLGWLRFLPVGETALPGWGGACVAIGLAAAIYAALIGIDQRDPKVVLAYSSVSQIGIMTTAFGMILIEPLSSETLILAIAFFALHHGLAKTALFLGAGLARTRLDARRRLSLCIGLALPALALAGAPLTSGMLAKSALDAGEGALAEPWPELLRVLMPLTSVATALLMARFLVLVSREPAECRPPAERASWPFWGVSVILVIFLPWWLMPPDPSLWTARSIIRSVWPLGLAVVIGLTAVRLWRQAGSPRIPAIPEGDVLLPLEWLSARVWAAVVASGALARATSAGIRRAAGVVRGRAWRLVQSTSHTEALLNRWRVALVLALLLGAAVAALGAR